MISKTMRCAAACAALAGVALAGCGGGSDAPAAVNNSSTNPAQAFAAAYGAGLTQMNTQDGLTNSSFHDQFASNYLDAGTSKTQLVDGMKLDAAALGSASFSLFPMASLSDVTVTNCDSQGVCTLTGTLTNGDADTTAVTFTTQVVVANGTVRLLGDQQAS